MSTPVIAIFDIGKTNKKIILFDEHYKVVSEQSRQFEEIKDENGQACDDIGAITLWIKDTIEFLYLAENITIKAVNVSAHGASFVHIDSRHEVLTPLYNYLNPYPVELLNQFYTTYGGELNVSMQTASPALGNLNSGLQLYKLKYERPHLFRTIKYSLHLPQYISSVITGKAFSDITSIGCHTYLWDFSKNTYHDWVTKEKLVTKFPKLSASDDVVKVSLNKRSAPVPVGAGLHDSSAALIPYFLTFNDPFVLISTGTWCITLNPFNSSPLTEDELRKDCLCYLSYQGKPVKASRLFAGHDHEQQTKRLARHFKKSTRFFNSIKFDAALVEGLKRINRESATKYEKSFLKGSESSVFELRDLNFFESYEQAYHQLMLDIIAMQAASTQLVLKNTEVKKIFVDGGFSRNAVYMSLLAEAFPQMEVYGATVAQSTSLGAALAIHKHWNSLPIPDDLINLKRY